MPATRVIRVRVDILNMRGETLSTIGQRLQDGEVTMIEGAEGASRSLRAAFFDPDQRMRFDSDAPTAGSLFANRQLRVRYGVKVPHVGWVDAPAFTGPLMTPDRDDALMNLECQGREVLAQQPVWKTYTVPKGVTKTDAIRRIMRECAGETRFDIPDLKVKLAAPATLTPEPPDKRPQGYNANTPWALCKKIAESMSMHLFYDGFGVLRLRRLPDGPLFTFDESLVTSAPKVKFDMTKMKNAVRVTGKVLHEGKEKKGPQIPTHTVRGEAEAPDHHPLSPGKNGLGWEMPDGSEFRRVIPELITNDAVRSDQEADRLAARILKDRLAQQVDVSFDALPVPHLEELDMVRVKYEDIALNFRLREFSLPLTHAGLMSVGTHKRVTKPRRR